TQGLVRVMNAYNQGGLEAARAEAQKIQEEDADTQKKVEEVKKQPRSLTDSVETGFAEGGIATDQLMYNVTTLGKALYTEMVYGTDSPEWRAGEKQDLVDLNMLNDANQTLPEEQTTTGRIVRGTVSGLTQAPAYI